MTGKDEALADELLNSQEGIAEVFGVLHCGNVAAHQSPTLVEGAAAQFQGIETEVDMVQTAACPLALHLLQHGRNYLLYVADLAACAYNYGTWTYNLVAVGVLLGHAQRVLAGGHVDLQGAAEVAQCLNGTVQTCVLALLCTAGPHPVGAQADAVHGTCTLLVLYGKGCPYQVGQCLCHCQHAACCRVGQCCLGCMTQCGGNTLLATVVESHGTAVAQGQLQFALTLLACHAAADATVHLVGQPVLACYGLQGQEILQVCLYLCRIDVLLVAVCAFHGLVHHDGLGRRSEHLLYGQVEGTYAVGLLEGEAVVACCLAHGVHGGTFALGNAAHMLYGLFVNEQTHALLALVGNDFLGGESLVADGQFVHVYDAATLLDKFAQTVHVSCRTMVVDADDGVVVLLAQGAYHVVGALLHFGVGTLYGVQLDATAVTAGFHGTYTAATKTDAVVLTTHHHNLVAGLGLAFQTVALCAVAHTACKHDNLVIGISLLTALLVVLESQHRTADEGLAELVAEVAGTVGGLYENLLGSLVQPLAYGQYLFPLLQACIVLGTYSIALQA